jgi:hypothetical protein
MLCKGETDLLLLLLHSPTLTYCCCCIHPYCCCLHPHRLLRSTQLSLMRARRTSCGTGILVVRATLTWCSAWSLSSVRWSGRASPSSSCHTRWGVEGCGKERGGEAGGEARREGLCSFLPFDFKHARKRLTNLHQCTLSAVGSRSAATKTILHTLLRPVRLCCM